MPSKKRSWGQPKKRVVGRPGATKGRKLPVEVLTADEIRALIRACSNRAPTGIRNRALIAVLWRGGLGVSEALKLQAKDVDSQDGTLRILIGKGGRSRTVGLDPAAFALLLRWMDQRKRLRIKGRPPIFCTLMGGPLKGSYVRQMLQREAARAGIEKRVHPQGLRHAHAAELMAEGVPVNAIQAQLGHSNLATTSRYLAHIAPKQVIETIRARTWTLEEKRPRQKP